MSVFRHVVPSRTALFLLVASLVACNAPSGDLPDAPSSVAVEARPGYNRVTWEHPGERVTGFVVYRGLASDGAASDRLATLPAEARSYDDTAATPGVSYRYAVAAVAASGRSGPTKVSVEVEALAPPTFVASLEPSDVAVAVGGRATTTLVVTPQHGYSGEFTLELDGDTAGLTLHVGSALVVRPGEAARLDLTLAAELGATQGERELGLLITGPGATPARLPLNLTVLPPNAPPHAVIWADVTSGDAPLEVTFEAREAVDPDGEIVAFEWDFGDPASGEANAASGAQASHTFGRSGEYLVSLTVTDDGGLAYTTRAFINVGNGVPVARFTVTPDAGLAPLEATLDAGGSLDPDGEIVEYAWSVADAEGEEVWSDLGEVVVHVFPATGRYEVTLTVTDDEGLTARSLQEVVVDNHPPVPAFTFSPTGGAAPLLVAFDADGSHDPNGEIVAYEWEFEDDRSSHGQNVASGEVATHLFERSGAYPVTLTVTDDEGAVAALTLTVTVENAVPVPGFSVSGDLVYGAPVTFDASASLDPDGEIERFAWFVDDEEEPFAAGAVVTRTFERNGEHTVTLRVWDDEGASATSSQVVEVGNAPPVARIKALPEHGTAPLTVAFDGTGSFDLDGEVIAYAWTFDDPASGEANASDLPQPQHIYQRGGTYTVTLVVTDDQGEPSAVAAKDIVVVNPPPAPFLSVIGDPVGDAPLTVTFSAAGSSDANGEITEYRWDFGDGGTAVTTSEEVTHTFTDGGRYAVTLTAVDDEGATADASVTVEAYTEPLVTNADDDGPGSLRHALAYSPPGSTVTFDPAFFGAPRTIALTREMRIDRELTVIGPGPELLTVAGAGDHRLLRVVEGAGTVEISGITFTGGNAAAIAGDESRNGAAVLAEAGTHLALTDTAFSDNHARDGGAVYAYGTLTVHDSAFTNNRANSEGGAIKAIEDLTLRSVTMTENEANLGGAVLTFYGHLDLELGTFSGNHASRGGALYLNSTADVRDSTFSNNYATNRGGGIYTGATALLIDSSTFFENETHVDPFGGGGRGGAIYGEWGFEMRNSTVINDRAALGSAFYLFAGHANVVFSSIGDDYWGRNDVFLETNHDARATITASIFLGTTLTASNPLYSGGYNHVAQSGTREGPRGEWTTGDYVHPFLDDIELVIYNREVAFGEYGPGGRPELGDHGGPTPTVPLWPGSMVLDSVPSHLCQMIQVDQRGEPRPQTGSCDAGAYEHP